MKNYEITIKPLSGFATPLKGDTLFGHICWQAAYDGGLLGRDINNLLEDYKDNPFLVISSAFIKIGDSYAFKRPDMPAEMLFDLTNLDKKEIIARRKELKGKKWIFLRKNQKLQSLKSNDLYLNDKELLLRLMGSKSDEEVRRLSKLSIESIVIDYTQPHNTINRLTGTTGEDQFAPYSVDQKVFIKELELVVFAGLRDDIPVEGLIKALRQIGTSGFGKDASTGLGRFEVLAFKEVDLCSIGSDNPNACYTLAPSVPEPGVFDEIFFTPFTRFGRHGDVLAKSGRPFKNPVIMADEGAVFIVKNPDVFKKPYIGKAVFGISKAEPKAVTQGYSLYIPIKVEG